MLREPLLRADVVYVAWPALNVPVPSAVFPSLNVTVPPGVPLDAVTVAVNVTESPAIDGLRLEMTVVVVATNAFTVCVNGADVLVANVAFPAYTAVMLRDPVASVDVVNVACPALNVPVPSVVLASLNVTVPAGVPPGLVTVAVNVTGWPANDGLRLDTTAVVVVNRFTVCVNTGDVLVANVMSPPYAAVMLRAPLTSADVVKVACPALSVPVPRVELPSLNVTIPDGTPTVLVTDAVNVTAWPTFDGFRLVAIAVKVVAFTVCTKTAEVLPACVASPP
jgi:hypothetical protein